MLLNVVVSFLTTIAIIVHATDALAGAALYKFVDENSVVHFSDAPTDSRFKRVIEFDGLNPGVDKANAFIDEIYVASDVYDVDPALVVAVMGVESDFEKRATSGRGAMGLMQLMPGTAKKYEVTDAYSTSQNIWAGVKHLKHLLSLFGGDIALALAAYNAGEDAVKRYGGIPPYPETRRYIRKVLDRYNSLR